jgi:hypothetical protein
MLGIILKSLLALFDHMMKLWNSMPASAKKEIKEKVWQLARDHFVEKWKASKESSPATESRRKPA